MQPVHFSIFKIAYSNLLGLLIVYIFVLTWSIMFLCSNTRRVSETEKKTLGFEMASHTFGPSGRD